MARRPRDNDDDISLFPFLSIIACVIGVLTMMISTLALAQMDNEDVAVIEAYENAANATAQADAEIDRLKRELTEKLGAATASLKNDLSTSEKELAELAKQLEAVQKQLAEQQELKVVIPTLEPGQRESVASMAAELKELDEQLAQMEKDLKERKDASESKVSVLPSGSGLNFQPYFVECAAGAIVMHTMQPPKRIRASEMVKDKDFLEVLSKVANNQNMSVVFLIRSDALNVYRAAKKICDDRSIRHGKLPVVGNGKIDLSAFSEAANR